LKLRLPALLLSLFGFAGLSLLSGTAGSDFADPAVQFAVAEIRLPRLIAALAIGIAAGMATTLLQLTLKTQIAEPALFGLTGFAAVGTIISLLLGFGFGTLGSWAMAALFSALGLMPLIWAASQLTRNANRADSRSGLQLTIIGIALGAFALGLVGVVAATVSDPRLRSLSLWAFGSLTLVSLEQAILLITIVLPIAAVALLLVPRLRKLSLGKAWLKGLGLSFSRLATLSLALVALLSASSAFVSGSVAFVGLMSVVLARQLFGHGLRQQLLASSLIGCLALIASDLIARSLFAPFELPLGAITALVGVPVLVFAILQRSSRA
jgi:iron complex transport system permease protein